MKKSTELRIKRILAHYHPQIEPGEEVMSFEEAKRLVAYLLAKGRTEEEAFDCLKYCTVGADFKEKAPRKDKLLEAIDENTFYTKMAMKTAGHVGTLVLTLHTLELARQKGRVTKLAEGLFTTATILLLLDDVEVLLHEFRGRR